jgi:hypothetical protein
VLELLVNDQEHLIKHNNRIDKTDAHKEGFNSPESTMEAQKNKRERDNTKFPDPKFVSIKAHDRKNNGVELNPFQVDDEHRKEGI